MIEYLHVACLPWKEEDSEDDEVDSDFDVDESTWHVEEELGEEQLEQKKKKKQWIKPVKPKVCASTYML